MSKSDYPYIEAWGRMMNSDPTYVWEQRQQARRDDAPQTAIYWSIDDRRWRTFDDINDANTKSVIARMVSL